MAGEENKRKGKNRYVLVFRCISREDFGAGVLFLCNFSTDHNFFFFFFLNDQKCSFLSFTELSYFAALTHSNVHVRFFPLQPQHSMTHCSWL